MKHRTPVQGISTEKSPGRKSRKVGSERTGAGLPEDLTWAHRDTVHTGTCTHSGTHAAEAVNNWWSCRYLVDAKAPGRKKKDSVDSFQTGLAASLCVCMTRAPMRSAQAASLTVSRNGSEWEARHERSVSSSPPLIGSGCNRAEVTRSVIGWHRIQRKKVPLSFPSIPAVQREEVVCVWVGVHTVACAHRVVCVHAKHSYADCSSTCLCVLVCVMRDLILCGVLCTSAGYLIQHETLLGGKKKQPWGHLWCHIKARWVTVTALMRWCK